MNEISIMGNVGKQPSVHKSEKCLVAKFSICTNRTWTDKSTGSVQGEKEWHDIVAFGQQAEYVQKCIGHGNRVLLFGRKKTRDWQDPQTGGKRQTTDIIASDIYRILTMRDMDNLVQVTQQYQAQQSAPGVQQPMAQPQMQQQGGQQPMAQPPMQPQNGQQSMAQPQMQQQGGQQPMAQPQMQPQSGQQPIAQPQMQPQSGQQPMAQPQMQQQGGQQPMAQPQMQPQGGQQPIAQPQMQPQSGQQPMAQPQMQQQGRQQQPMTQPQMQQQGGYPYGSPDAAPPTTVGIKPPKEAVPTRA